MTTSTDKYHSILVELGDMLAFEGIRAIVTSHIGETTGSAIFTATIADGHSQSFWLSSEAINSHVDSLIDLCIREVVKTLKAHEENK